MNELFIFLGLFFAAFGRARLVPFVLALSVAYVEFIPLEGRGYFYQQLLCGFAVLTAMIYTKAKEPQQILIKTDIGLNAFLFFSYLTDFYYSPLQPHVVKIVTVITALIFIGIFVNSEPCRWLRQTRLFCWLEKRIKKKASWIAKELSNDRPSL